MAHTVWPAQGGSGAMPGPVDAAVNAEPGFIEPIIGDDDRVFHVGDARQ
ncbi:hypothetical protein ACMT1E_01425 [Sphingomonas flavalba]